MMEYESSDYWRLGFDDFKMAHDRYVRRMARAGILTDPKHSQLSGGLSNHSSYLHICPMCGWWLAVDRAILSAIEWQHWYITLISSSVLQELDVTDIRVPVNDVRNYLARRFEARRSLHPRIFEETVASVFEDHGYRATVTAYSRDGGIDVVLVGANGDRIGVQVKRYQRSIEVEQIRSFLGALIVGRYTRGIFVSAADFQRGAKKLAKHCTNQHIPIELVDGKRFLELLGIAQLNKGPDPNLCGFRKDYPPKFSLYSDYNLNSF